MTHTLILVPVNDNVDLTITSCGIIDAIRAQNIAVNYFKPIAQDVRDQSESLETVKAFFNLTAPESLLFREVLTLLVSGQHAEMLETIVGNFCRFGLAEPEVNSQSITVMQGLSFNQENISYTAFLNQIVAQAFSAKVILVISQNANVGDFLAESVDALSNLYQDKLHVEVLGYIVNGFDETKKQVFAQCRTTNLGIIASVIDLSDDVADLRNQVTQYISTDWIAKFQQSPSRAFLSPPFFLHNLIDLARKFNKRIVLPEGNEIRTLKAASICHERQIARCVLLGNKIEIKQICLKAQIQLPNDIEIREPAEIADQYVDRMVELRQHKGLTKEAARELLHNDTIVLGTMMLEQGDVDGLVSGAVHLTSDTIRPALQLLKTSAGHHIVSSSFFMCLPTGTILYADCALNRNPSIAELAEIAIQSADTAKIFCMEPRVGFLSFSTGQSGAGEDVDHIVQAMQLAKQKRPDLMIEGPLQYDAAADSVVAQLKMPNSKIAGRINVYIFPDLNTGNIVYKAVQRTNNIVCVGPVLQGLKKPVNDLSRGASVEDIVYTIAVTAIQSEQER